MKEMEAGHVRARRGNDWRRRPAAAVSATVQGHKPARAALASSSLALKALYAAATTFCAVGESFVFCAACAWAVGYKKVIPCSRLAHSSVRRPTARSHLYHMNSSTDLHQGSGGFGLDGGGHAQGGQVSGGGLAKGDLCPDLLRVHVPMTKQREVYSQGLQPLRQHFS